MPSTCCVPTCNNNCSMIPRVSFFTFPKDEAARKKWVNAIRRETNWKPSYCTKICSWHFPEGKEYGPTRFSWNAQKYKIPDPEPPDNRKKIRIQVIQIQNPILTVASNEPIAQNVLPIVKAIPIEEVAHEEIIHNVNEGPPKMQYEYRPNEDKEKNVFWEKVSDRLTAENKALKEKLDAANRKVRQLSVSLRQQEQKPYCQFSRIVDNDQVIKLYTGLPTGNKVVEVAKVLQGVGLKYIANWNVTKMSIQDQLLLTLMRLHLNAHMLDLAARYGISLSTARNVFRTVLSALHELLFQRLMETIPSLEGVQNAPKPEFFQQFPNCRQIWGYAQIRIGLPGKSQIKEETINSTYKYCNTFKALISVAPNGAIVFTSKLFSAGYSDKEIVLKSGILNQCEPGEMILAVKDFGIDSILPPGVTFNSFKFSKSQSKDSKDQYKEEANHLQVYNHVEKVVENIKQYSILNVIPHYYRTIADTIWQVCAALVNLQTPD